MDQPEPIPNDTIPIWDLVIADMRARDAIGRATYGTPLQAGNGRNAIADAYAECLDMAAYLRQAIAESSLPPFRLKPDSTDAERAAYEYVQSMRRKRTSSNATWFDVAAAFVAGTERRTDGK